MKHTLKDKSVTHQRLSNTQCSFKKIISILFITLYTTSCATIFTGTTAKFTVYSHPEEGHVYLNGNYAGITPYTSSFIRDRDYNITVRKEGYAEGTAVAMRHFNAVALLNLVNIFFWIIDIGTGAVWSFDQESITVPLRREKTEVENL